MINAHDIAPPAVAVRPATTEDLPPLGTLGALLMAMHHELDTARFIAPTVDTATRYAEFLGSQLTKPGVLILVAERDGEVVGYVYAGIEGPDYMSLRGPAGVGYDLIVNPVHRGHGVGRALLDAMLCALRSQGASQIVLSAAEGNVAAQRLFANVGFRRTMVEMTADNFGECK